MASKISGIFKNLKKYWRVAPDGRFLSFKEIASLAAGGIGVKFIVYCISSMVLCIGNTLIGNTIGLSPSSIYVIYVISVIAGFPLTALRAKMIDGARSIRGKYRPYIITMGIPTVLLGIGFIWMPYEKMSEITQCVVILLFNIGFQFFYNFLIDANESIINVLSPNSIERTDVYAVKSVIENISPSIAGIFLPIVAKLITGENTLYNLKVYRVLYPPMLIVGFLISILIYVNTQERIVQPKDRTLQMSFVDAFRAVASNKYFWIISLAGWIGFLEGSFAKIMEWMYNYQGACTSAQYSIIVAVSGNASLWPNLFAPFLIRRFGKKKVLILSNVLNIIFIALMLPVVRMNGANVIWFLLVFIFVNQLLTSCGHFMNPALNADIRDYQQYISGERIDGMFSAVGLIGSVITMITSAVLPFVQEKAGLNSVKAAELGYTNTYDVLYNKDLFVSICSILIMASVIGAALNVIPFFFYDLTEAKQKGMINVLRVRAFFEDKVKGLSTEEEQKEIAEIIKDAQLLHSEEIEKDTTKNVRLRNEQIQIAKIVWDEIDYFNTDFGKLDLQNALMLSKDDVKNLPLNIVIIKKNLQSFLDNTASKDVRRKIKMQLRELNASENTVYRHFPNGIVFNDYSILEEFFEEFEATEKKIDTVISQIKKAKEEKTSCAQYYDELKMLRKKRNELNEEIKEVSKEKVFYNRVMKPVVKAQRVIEKADWYKDLVYEK